MIALNQFAGVLNNATGAVAAVLDTTTKGVPIVVFNPFNIVREDLVEAGVSFPEGMPKEVHVIGPDNNEVAAQISNGKVIFLAEAPQSATRFTMCWQVQGRPTDIE